jgi:hypothetical protein
MNVMNGMYVMDDLTDTVFSIINIQFSNINK